jgi:hypothetical protein
MEDIRLMRDTETTEITQLVGTTAVPLYGQDPYIVAVTLSNNGPQAVTISTLPTIKSGVGILILTTFQPYTFRIEDLGTAITRGLWGICAAAATAQVTAVPVYLRKD